MPLESIQLDSSNKTYAIRKKIHTFFLLLRSSILKLYYLCDCGSSISEIQHWSSPLNSLLNATGLTLFGFSKTKLCSISHNDLIMDWFNRANLYEFTRFIISSFSSESDRQETTFRVLVVTLYRIPILCSERELWRFSHDHLFEMKSGSLKRPNFHRSYL